MSKLAYAPTPADKKRDKDVARLHGDFLKTHLPAFTETLDHSLQGLYGRSLGYTGTRDALPHHDAAEQLKTALSKDYSALERALEIRGQDRTNRLTPAIVDLSLTLTRFERAFGQVAEDITHHHDVIRTRSKAAKGATPYRHRLESAQFEEGEALLSRLKTTIQLIGEVKESFKSTLLALGQDVKAVEKLTVPHREPEWVGRRKAAGHLTQSQDASPSYWAGQVLVDKLYVAIGEAYDKSEGAKDLDINIRVPKIRGDAESGVGLSKWNGSGSWEFSVSRDEVRATATGVELARPAFDRLTAALQGVNISTTLEVEVGSRVAESERSSWLSALSRQRQEQRYRTTIGL